MNSNEFRDEQSILNYIMSSKSIITLYNEITNVHFTLKFVKAKKPVRSLYWAYVLTMPDNESDGSYKFLGAFSQSKGYIYSKGNAQIKEGAKSAQTMEWFFQHLFAKTLKSGYPNIHIYKSSKCNNCGRLLTNPMSLMYGHGAECMSQGIKNGTIIISDKDDDKILFRQKPLFNDENCKEFDEGLKLETKNIDNKNNTDYWIEN